jgi:hypothetical protein
LVVLVLGCGLAPSVHSAPPCCAVTDLDLQTGIVTAVDIAAGRTFRFRVDDGAVLASLEEGREFEVDVEALEVGRAFAGDFSATPGRVRPNQRPCCTLTSLSPRSVATAPPVTVDPAVFLPKTDFDARAHGFEFDNFFTGEMLVEIPGIGTVNLGGTTYGLCGGMIFSAFDTFNLDSVTPDVPTTPPTSGTPMRSYIYGRQMDSLKHDDWYLVRRLITWMRKPLKDNTVPNPLAKDGYNVIERGLIHLSGKQFAERIRPELDARRPVTIVLVKASGEDLLSDPKAAFSKNHQVLAIGYRRHGDEWDIDVYDPNFSNTIQTLHVDARRQTEKGSSEKTGRFRGFFRAPYKLERPPWVPDSPRVAERVGSFPVLAFGPPDVDD